MHTRSGFVASIACLVIVGAGCATGTELSPRTQGRRPDATPPVSRLDRIKRNTAAACTPTRRFDALYRDAGPFCVPFDSIPALDHPRLVAADKARLPGDEPVVAVRVGSMSRAYPIRYLTFHEVVNDLVARVPVAITFCPLCNSAVVFDRRVGRRTLSFGVSGKLRYANLVMFDRRSLSLWQQATGEAVAGDLIGKRLRLIPSSMVSFASWRAENPSGMVMAAPGDFGFDYGTDPYAFYDRDPRRPSPFVKEAAEYAPPARALPPKWRVVGVTVRRDAVAFASPVGPGRVATRDARAAGVDLIAFFKKDVAQPGKRVRLARSPRGWSATVWRAELGERRLSFSVIENRFVETTTHSEFSFFGRARSGPLAGLRLRPVPEMTSFWFAWVHFYPDTKLVGR